MNPLDPIPSPILKDRIAQIRATIPSPVRLIAVTKTVSVEQMRSAYAAGVRDFGENRVQEALAKHGSLADLADITWHLIGHLQGNKARIAVQMFHWIHSVDSLALAQRLATLAQTYDRPLQLCLQVKLRPDPQKTGWEVSDLERSLPHLAALSHPHTPLNICGLMTIPPLGSSPPEVLNIFKETHQLAQHLSAQSALQFTELSLGMSGDYPLALQSGSTMIRLGSILFGPRS